MTSLLFPCFPEKRFYFIKREDIMFDIWNIIFVALVAGILCIWAISE